jgi:hypothetical protein
VFVCETVGVALHSMCECKCARACTEVWGKGRGWSGYTRVLSAAAGMLGG